jgi:hypothetical protein
MVPQLPTTSLVAVGFWVQRHHRGTIADFAIRMESWKKEVISWDLLRFIRRLERELGPPTTKVSMPVKVSIGHRCRRVECGHDNPIIYMVKA